MRVSWITYPMLLLLAACDTPKNVIEIRNAYDGPIAVAIDKDFRNDYVMADQNRVFALGEIPIFCVSRPDTLIPRTRISAVRLLGAGDSSDTGPSSSSLPLGIYGQSMITPNGTHLIWMGVGQEELQTKLKQEFFSGILYKRFDKYWLSDWPDSVADHVKQNKFHSFVREFCEAKGGG